MRQEKREIAERSQRGIERQYSQDKAGKRGELTEARGAGEEREAMRGKWRQSFNAHVPRLNGLILAVQADFQ